MDAGSTFYATDFWALWDVGIILVGLAFFVTRMVGLANHHRYATDVAFDILSVEALFLVPRYVVWPDWRRIMANIYAGYAHLSVSIRILGCFYLF